MLIQDFEKDVIEQEIAQLDGLSSIGDGNNQKIDQYFHSFMDWLEWNNVLDVINKYAQTNMNLHYVTSHDFLIWLLHYGDVYDNILQRLFSDEFLKEHLDLIRKFGYLRSIHPKYSFTVALTHNIDQQHLLSDNDLDKLIPILANIPDNTGKKILENSAAGKAIFVALYALNNFAIERVALDCI